MPGELEGEGRCKDLPREGGEGKEEGSEEVEEEDAERGEETTQFERETIEGVGGDAVPAVEVPLAESGLRLDEGEGFGGDDDGGVAGAGVLVDKHVVGAVGDVVVVDEAVVFEEEGAAVAEVAAVAGEGRTEDGGAEVLDAVEEVVVLLQPVEEGWFVGYAAVAEDDVDMVVDVA